MDSPTPSAADAADEFDRLFRAVFAAYHRRDGKHPSLGNAQRASLTHLSMAGPLTVGEIAVHLERSQSATSEIVAHLERYGLLERRTDEADARRSLLWLSAAGFQTLDDERRVLGHALLEKRFAHLDAATRQSILSALRTFLDRSPDHP